MRSRIAAVAVLTLACGCATASTTAADGGAIRSLRFPHTAVVGKTWQALVAVSGGAAPMVLASGVADVRARVKAAGRGRFRISITFPRSGRWTITARSGPRSVRLGTVVVDVRPTPLLADVFALAAEPSGSLLIGQVHSGGIVRATPAGRTTKIVPDLSVFHLSVGESGAAYITLHDNGGIYRLDARRRLEPLGFPADAAIAVEAAGSVYALHGDRLLRRDPSGRISPVAGGFASPLGVAAAPDGDIYVADTGNGVIRRVNVGSGATEIVARDLGYVVSVAIAPDGTIWSSSVAERGRPGVWRTTPGRPSTRVLGREVSAVTLGRDGAVYACVFRDRRILRINAETGRAETVLRSG